MRSRIDEVESSAIEREPPGGLERRFHRLMSRGADRLRSWPTAPWLHWFDRRLGLYLVTLAAIYGLKWRGGYDLDAFMLAAGDVANGGSAYARTIASGVGQWGIDQVYVSPPFVAHLLAPLVALRGDALFATWGIAGLLAVAAAIRALEPDALARQAPRLIFGLGFLWATVFLGQVNLFVLAGLLLALGSRNDRLAGLGLAGAVLLRGTPLLFGVVLLLERRWRALAWSGAFLVAGILVSGPGEWILYARLTREIAALPTLGVSVQTSLIQFGWPLVITAGAAVLTVVILAGRVRGETALLRGTAIGLALVLLPGNGWVHWFSFALAPLLVAGDRALWSRRALVAFLVVGFLPMGWPSVLVGLVILAAMARRVLVGDPHGGAESSAATKPAVTPDGSGG
jgi:hypothetical protein